MRYVHDGTIKEVFVDFVEFDRITGAVEIYKDDGPHSVMLSTEYGMWIRKWKQHNRSDWLLWRCEASVMMVHPTYQVLGQAVCPLFSRRLHYRCTSTALLIA